MDPKYKHLPWALAKELSQTQSRPSWESSNEGIHERISFDDTIWGFNLAGGAFYDTPLRVTQVKENSRADKAGIKVGDILRFINDVDTSLLTVQEAHDIILQSGIAIKLKLSAPDVEEPYHYTYEDEILEELREMKRKRDEKAKQNRKPFTGAKTNSQWSCAWPCNKKRDVMYRESNCFLIPSKHEEKMRLNREKKKLEEDRAAENMLKEKIISIMKTQNAYNMMESDEEIEPQYFELLYKNKDYHIKEDNSKRQEPNDNNITSEISETLYKTNHHLETNGDEDQELSRQNNVDVIENYNEDEIPLNEEKYNNCESNDQFLNNVNITQAEQNGKFTNEDEQELSRQNNEDDIENYNEGKKPLNEENYNDFEINDKFLNNDNITQAEQNGKFTNDDSEDEQELIRQNNEDDIENYNKDDIENYNEDEKRLNEENYNDFESNEQFLNNHNIMPAVQNEIVENDDSEDEDITNKKETNILNDNFSFINGDMSKTEFANMESEPENESQSDNQEIDLQNGKILNGEDETQLSDDKCSIPSDDDDLFHEELVIFNESETDSLNDDSDKELVTDVNQRDGYQEIDETK